MNQNGASYIYINPNAPYASSQQATPQTSSFPLPQQPTLQNYSPNYANISSAPYSSIPPPPYAASGTTSYLPQSTISPYTQNSSSTSSSQSSRTSSSSSSSQSSSHSSHRSSTQRRQEQTQRNSRHDQRRQQPDFLIECSYCQQMCLPDELDNHEAICKATNFIDDEDDSEPQIQFSSSLRGSEQSLQRNRRSDQNISPPSHTSISSVQPSSRSKRSAIGPELSAASCMTSAPSFEFRTSFEHRLSTLKQQLKQYLDEQIQRAQSREKQFLKIQTSRRNILGSAADILDSTTASDWCLPLQVIFDGEQGIDAGGLTREWMNILINEAIRQQNQLFVCDTVNEFRISILRSNMRNIVEKLKLYKLIGIVIGKAVTENITISARFDSFIFKSLLGFGAHITDLQSLDQNLFNQLKQMEESEDVSSWGLTFSVSEEMPNGEQKTVSLVDGGEDLDVTNENKSEFIQLRIHQRLLSGIEPQLHQLRDGFQMLVPGHFLREFSPSELELIICGPTTINVNEWKANTKYESPLTASHSIVKWFWEILKEEDEKFKRQVLQYVTGLQSPPATGFAGLVTTVGDEQYRFTLRSMSENAHHLPVAHTCFYQLDLPQYQTKAQLKNKMKKALEQIGSGFQIS